MSGNKARLPLAAAESLAAELMALLTPGCERIEVAGSVRRRRADVGDIEVVCVPKVERSADLFGGTGDAEWNELDALCTDLRVRGVFGQRFDTHGRTAWGSRHKRAAYRDAAIDLFCVLPPASWGSIFAIRTGPRLFSRALVTPPHKVVWDDESGRSYGPGLMPSWLLHREGHFVHAGTREVFPTPEESDVFALLKLPFIPPQERDAFMEARAAAGVRR